jgi:hypothetical protein
MTRIGRYSNPAMNLHWASDGPPAGDCEVVLLPTPDRSATGGLLYVPPGSTASVVCITHPRVDMSSHYLIPALVKAGFAVFAQRTRTTNNDLTAVHEELLIDLAIAHAFLRRRGFERLFLLGNSGGASLYCFYLQQAGRASQERLRDTPAGGAVDLTLEMPQAEGLILLAPHPGQGELLKHSIDPSVRDESDGTAVDADISIFEPANGFRSPPNSSCFSEEFLDRYREAQLERVERIDGIARGLLDCRARLRAQAEDADDPSLRRAALTPSFMTVFRTDADPRSVDLSIEPSERDYGSIFSRRPDLTNYGTVGFGRLTTPEAWLSTWSWLSSRAAIRLTGPEIAAPTLVVTYSGDNSVYPGDSDAIVSALANPEKTTLTVVGDHYGYAVGTEERSGGRAAAAGIVDWLNAQLR